MDKKKYLKKVNIVVSCYNEENCIYPFFEDCKKNLSQEYDWEIIFVNDGSEDETKSVLWELKQDNENTKKKNKISPNDVIKKLVKKRKKDEDFNNNIGIKIINFSKNFGHEQAMLAGLDYSDGDYVVFMDSDLQHPIEKLNEIVDKMEDGYNIVSMVRTKNKGKSWLSEFLSKLFYKIINSLCKTTFSENASDFFAIDKMVCDFLKYNYREKVRFMRGIVQNIGFNKTSIEYEAKERLYGKSRYNFSKLLRMAENTLYSYTNLPLILGKWLGAISTICGLIVLVYTLVTRKGAPSGYATLVILNCFMFAILFMVLGFMGEYIAIILKEIKDRPDYIIENIIE